MYLRTAKNAFTLVELIMVIVIIGLLASIVVPKFADQGDSARISASRTNLENLRTAVALFKAQEGIYPAVLADLTIGGPSTGNIYMRAIPFEEMSTPKSDTVIIGVISCAGNPGGWLYDPVEGDVALGFTTCPFDCGGDDPCTEW